jgi:hypothetical protein
MTKLWIFFGTTQGWTGLLIANLTLTALMTGLIWFVQLVHYPLMALADRNHYTEFQLRHEFRTSLIVVPVMLAELAVASLLVALLFHPALPLSSTSTALLIANAVLLGGVWLSTFLVQVPCHQVLNQGFDANAHEWLVTSNWLRTVAWTLKLGVAIGFLVSLLYPGQPQITSEQ